uniref:Uncharacterized protein n=1 Tax=Streptomyces ambofaciens (strain ATCC 23877 / 3486 / DSM 40053 / JCM 4204 / NBRC 12836 / NRRL B-2516) TaxID=278992 RepID=A0AE76_STRA7|nr:hypothetical protein SAMR1076 [Streptomyces ambofaciens ATCC 23877]
MCEKIGDTAQEKVKEAWDEVWESVLGDVINSAADVTKWTIKKVLTVSLMGPSVDLEGTGLFGKDATLAGMLTWLGLVIATAGAMWQIGKMAITGQSRHIGRALLGWVENTVLSAVGVALIALLLVAGDALTTGLVDAAFKDDGKAYETIVTVMVPAAVKNPVTMLCVVTVLLLIGFVQLILVFPAAVRDPDPVPAAAGGRRRPRRRRRHPAVGAPPDHLDPRGHRLQADPRPHHLRRLQRVRPRQHPGRMAAGLRHLPPGDPRAWPADPPVRPVR